MNIKREKVPRPKHKMDHISGNPCEDGDGINNRSIE